MVTKVAIIIRIPFVDSESMSIQAMARLAKREYTDPVGGPDGQALRKMAVGLLHGKQPKASGNIY